MKKTLSVILAVLILLMSFPVVIMADDSTTETRGNTMAGTYERTQADLEALEANPNVVCKIGSTYYETVAAAIDAIKNDTDRKAIKLPTDPTALANVTIELIANTSISATLSCKNVAIVFEGNGYTLSSSAYVFQWSGADITVRNLTVSTYRTVVESRPGVGNATENIEVVLENCTVTTTGNMAVDFRGNGTTTPTSQIHTATIKNCIITTEANDSGKANSNPVYFNDQSVAHWNVTIEDTLLKDATKQISNTTNGIIAVRPNTTVNISIALKGNTDLVIAHAGATTNYGIVAAGGCNLTVDVEDSVTFSSESEKAIPTVFVRNADTYRDAGATYTANATALKNGVTFPTPTATNTDPAVTVYGWNIGESGDKIKAGGTYKDTDATTGLTFTPVFTEITFTDDAAAVEGGMVAKIVANGQTTYYGSLADAYTKLPVRTDLNGLTDAQKAESTITLLKSVTGLTDTTSITKAMILNGNGFEYSKVLDQDGHVFSITNTDVVFRNLTVKGGRNIQLHPNSKAIDVTVENCNFTSTKGASIDLRGDLDDDGSTLTVINSTVTTTGESSTNYDAVPIYADQGKKAGFTITLEGSTLNNEKGVYNGTISCITLKRKNSDATNNNMVLNLKNSTVGGQTVPTVLNMASTRTNNTMYGIYVDSGATTGVKNFTLNIDAGTQFNSKLPAAAQNLKTTYIKSSAAGTTTVTDNGAIYTANVEALKVGVVLPTLTKEGSTLLGWSDGTNLIAATKDAYKAEVTETKTFIPVFMSKDDFKIKGVSIRTEAPEGIRFGTTVSADFLAATQGLTVTYGMLVTPKKNLDDNLEELTLASKDLVEAAQLELTAAQLSDYNDGAKIYNIALIGIPESALDMDFTARAYVIIKDADGNTINTIYTDAYTANINEVKTILASQG